MQAPYSGQGSSEALQRIATMKGFVAGRVCDFPGQVFRAVIAPQRSGAPVVGAVACNGHEAEDTFERDAGGAQTELIFPILVAALDFGGDRLART